MGTFAITDDCYLNGEKFKVISGSIHYFRVVPEYWRDRLTKLKNMGCNTVETYLPYDRCAFVLSHDLAKESLYNVLAARDDTRICRVTRVLEAVAGNARDAEYLNLGRGKPVLLSTTIGYNEAEEPIEYSVARDRGDSNRFEVDLLIDTRLEP